LAPDQGGSVPIGLAFAVAMLAVVIALALVHRRRGGALRIPRRRGLTA
jgi:hypothetical protein